MRRPVLIIICIICFFTLKAQNTHIDSLRSLVVSGENDSLQVNNLILLSGKLCRTSPDEAILYGKKAKELAESINFKKGLAYALKSIGMGYYFQGKYLDVLIYWQQSLNQFESINDKLGMANMLNNLGAVYFNEGGDAKAIEYYLESLRISEEINDTLRIATALVNIGTVYLNKPNTHAQALAYYSRSLPMSEALGDHDAIGTSSVNIGELYLEQNDLDSALFYFEKSLVAYKKSETGNVPYSLTNIGKVYAKRKQFNRAIEYQKEAYEIARKGEAKLEMAQALISLANTSIQMNDYHLAINYFKQAQSLAEDIKASYELKNIYEGLANSFAQLSDFQNAYHYHTQFSSLKDTLYNAQMDKSIQALTLSFDIQKKQGQIDLLTKEKELTELSVQKQKIIRNSLIAFLILIIISSIGAIRSYLNKVKTNKLLDKQNNEIHKLLLNILPEKVAQELQLYGYATPKNYDHVTVLFTDFQEFSRISNGMHPKDLITELNIFFNEFDTIIEKHGLEKIKTIGDSYMCVGGLPIENGTHALDAVNAGLEIQEFIKQTNHRKSQEGKVPWNLRLGIHTGQVVAGVIGKKKYAFDIWGTSVNIASRMESMGVVGKVNISSATFELVKNQFLCEHRGKISAKNMEAIDMYFVNYKES